MAGGLTDKLQQFKRANENLKRISGRGGFLEQLQQRYLRIENSMKAARQIHERVGQRMIPAIRAQLAISYEKSGLHKVSGDLFRAAATEAEVSADARGILISPAAGFERKVYVRASS